MKNKHFSTSNEITKQLRKKQMATFIKNVNYQDRGNGQNLLHEANDIYDITRCVLKDVM